MKLFKTYSAQRASSHLDQYFRKLHAGHPDRPLQVQVAAPKPGLEYNYPLDSTNQPYHIASIGKLFTATLVQLLGERRLLEIDAPLANYLSPARLEQLFVYQGHDYSGQATIEHLLGHTSGVADYFEGETTGEKPFLDQVISNPQAHWTPDQLLDFTREHQAPVGAPGQVFNYSDTGYILLGLIIEAVTGKSFAHNLHVEFFTPLGMDDSYLMFDSQPSRPPQKPLAEIWFAGRDISRYESLSCDWAGGGIVSTTADLLKFNTALRSGRLVRPETLESMDLCTHKFRPGIYYGLGMLEIRFADFFFLLGRLPKVKGHIGILSTHLFYDPIHAAHIALNFGDNTRMVESFKALIEIENTLQRMV
jgi:D-alanyl-D-alanine carboxypeptidase